MKKLFLAIVAVAMSFTANAQQSTLSVNEVVEIDNDGYYGLPISLDNQQELTALEFHVKYTEGLELDGVEYTDILTEKYKSGRQEVAVYVPNWAAESSTFTVYCQKNPMQVIKSGKLMDLWVKGGTAATSGTVTIYGIVGSIEVAAGEKAPALYMPDVVINIKDGKATGIDEVAADAAAAVKKYVENGEIIIVKNGKKYNAAGVEK